MSRLIESPAWRAVRECADALAKVPIARLFADDAERATRFSATAGGLHLDFSKQRIDDAALKALLALAQQQDLPAWIERMFGGAPINESEGRAVLHVALRNLGGQSIPVHGEDVMPTVRKELDKLYAFADIVRSGAWRGEGGHAVRDVVNIGIGGSDLGPRMVCEALSPLIDGPWPHFVANVDGAQLSSILSRLDPARTLFIVTSKTFTTQETMANAHAARRWLSGALGEKAVASHFIAVSTNRQEVERFGISPARMFEFWDWVGGRYSLWSAVGLPIMLALGPKRFSALLDGAYTIDEHFRTAPLERNLPVLMGLLGIWNQNFLGSASQVVIPYAQRLQYFVFWLQQLEMESNGKRISRDSEVVDYATTPALWGDVGTNAQHAFFQMLHQGPAIHPVDFILPVAADHHEFRDQQRLLVANCFAQSAALMQGRDAETVRSELASRGLSGGILEKAVPHRVFPGNRPSNTLLMPMLDPYHLGALLALYEHRTFVQSVIWNINAFDQWGVELGKRIAGRIALAMGDGHADEFDASTRALIAFARKII
jgi:glucose-6-phosphate isomerase